MLKYFFIFFSCLAFSQLQDSSIKSLIESKEYDKAKKILLSKEAQNNIQDDLEYLGDFYALEKDWDNAAACFEKLTSL